MTRAEALAQLKRSYTDLEPGQKLTYRLFRPEDAPGVGRLFFQVYGDEYPVDEPYVPDLLIEANRAGRIRTVVVEAEDGSIVAQAACFQSSPPNLRLYEYGQLLLDKNYRNTFAAARMHQFFVKNMFGQMPGVDGTYGEAVCHHLATQKMIKGSGFRECGVELGLMPEAAYAGEGVHGRASCLYAQRVDQDQPGALFLPGAWGGLVQGIMGQWPLSRQVAQGDAPVPPHAVTELEAKHFVFAGVRRVTVRRIGADFAERLAAELAAATQGDAALVQLFLCLGEAWTGHAAQALRQAGFFFGGFMPQWFGETGAGPDALLAQRFMQPATLAGLRLYTPEMEQLGAGVVEDMHRASREFGAPAVTFLPVPE